MDYRQEICSRISLIINEFEEGNTSRFAKKIGEKESRIRSYTRESQKPSVPSSEIIAKICEKYMVSSEWILLGRGKMKEVIIEEKYKVTEVTNEYLIDRLEYWHEDSIEKKKIIESLNKQIAILKAEKKSDYPLLSEAEPEAKLKQE